MTKKNIIQQMNEYYGSEYIKVEKKKPLTEDPSVSYKKAVNTLKRKVKK